MAQDPEIIRTYLDALERGDFDEAAACFSQNARYSHPAYGEEPLGSPRHESWGRAAIREQFERRGRRPTRHELSPFVQDGESVYLTGLARNDRGDLLGSFIVSAVLDAETGEIAEFASYVSVPAVWATLEA